MFKKDNRLTKDKEFDNVFKNGRSNYSKVFGLKVIKNDLEYSRVGILINTKVSKSAVKRNKLRRQIREILKKQFENIKINNDIVVIALPPAIEKEYAELEESLLGQLKKLRVI